MAKAISTPVARPSGRARKGKSLTDVFALFAIVIDTFGLSRKSNERYASTASKRSASDTQNTIMASSLKR